MKAYLICSSAKCTVLQPDCVFHINHGILPENSANRTTVNALHTDSFMSDQSNLHMLTVTGRICILILFAVKDPETLILPTYAIHHSDNADFKACTAE